MSHPGNPGIMPHPTAMPPRARRWIPRALATRAAHPPGRERSSGSSVGHAAAEDDDGGAENLDVVGAACVIEAEQLCLLLGEGRRGDERVYTQAFEGLFRDSEQRRNEFLRAIDSRPV